MKHLYAHLADHRTPAYALTAAKRDFLRTFGARTVPFEWAAFGADCEIGRKYFRSIRPAEEGNDMTAGVSQRNQNFEAVKKMVLTKHINVAGVDYGDWTNTSIRDTRTPSR